MYQEIDAASADAQHVGRLTRLRESKGLVVAVVTLLLMLDVMLITVLEPLLPAMLFELDQLQQGGITWSAWLSSLFRCGGGGVSSIGYFSNSSSDQLDGSSERQLYAKYAPQIGLVLGLKPGVEVIGNLLVGPLVDRVGHKAPLLIGSGLYLVTAGMFGFSPNYPILLIARLLQAASSSLSTVAGLALLAATFAGDEVERAKAAAVAFGGLSFGLIMGFPFGAVLAQWFGRASPFLVLGGLSLLDMALRLAVRTPADSASHARRDRGNKDNRDKDNEEEEKKAKRRESTSASLKEIGATPVGARTLWRLATNRYVGTILMADFLIHFGLGAVFTTAPSFMQDTLAGSLWQMAVVALASTCLQFGVQYACSGWLAARPLARWRVLFPSLVVFGIGMLLYPVVGATRSIWFAALPESVLRIALALFTCTCFPSLNYLADRLFTAEYGAVNGLYTGAFNLGMFCGSQYAGLLLGWLGFEVLYSAFAMVLLASAAIGLVHRSLTDDRAAMSASDHGGRDHLTILGHSSASGTVV
ncbi:hypothetical protein BOX15_Mlig034172g3 [Macrostomum lignano]|uniref:MFS domain-containing protein n=2 Tax=Macrostomum lignano TaxID=282301 RepID=A0A1I8JI31_9PLAT|nr:hypothetical protein BOX15_Mlig034172g3 [Macrostomum lignano]